MKEKIKDIVYLFCITLLILSLMIIPKHISYIQNKKLMETRIQMETEMQIKMAKEIQDNAQKIATEMIKELVDLRKEEITYLQKIK